MKLGTIAAKHRRHRSKWSHTGKHCQPRLSWPDRGPEWWQSIKAYLIVVIAICIGPLVPGLIIAGIIMLVHACSSGR